MKILSIRDQGYHAGVMDGEGTICMCKRNNREHQYLANISIGNTNRKLLEYIFNTTHIGTISSEYEYKENGNNRKNRWIWYLKKHEMKPYLLQIKDYLIIKKEQAELMLEYLKLPSSRHSSISVPEKIIIQRIAIYDEMKLLNKRGK